VLLHSPVEGVNSFYGGMLHPVAVLTHLLVLIPLCILFGQHGLATMRRCLPALWLAFIATSFAGWLMEWEMGLAQELLLCGAMLFGLVALAARNLPARMLVALAVVAGVCLGYDTDTLQIPYGEERIFLMGAGLGLAMSTVCLAGASEAAASKEGRIGARVLASWVATASLLKLALDWTQGAT